GNIITTGYLDHKHCIHHLKSADVLWLMLNNDKQSPGKLYEYLGLRKPILSCVPEGFIKQTLKEAGGGIIVDPLDVNGIARAILEFYNLSQLNKLPQPQEGVVQQYNRIELTNELSKIFGFLVVE
ncbi:MAG: glycosyl transferase family 1, partial [Bacteroidota bacterium]|nr:glycosyl transferase family 1 [Bacteroidota bacterium]